ncbi:MAG: aminomethyl-transferring glycine dehydrogenase subunit GcvPB, partial [Abditibacteriales bacterium]|nr:aminomethyl-transferring glycine dehydrogenase subunit GcvPB [Abditibacteriales bacterium]
PLIFELSSPGRIGHALPPSDVPAQPTDVLLPATARRADAPPLPEVDELTLVRHFVRLSQMNFSIDTNFYPLGSCTMKYNPKINEVVAALPGVAGVHPLQSTETVQGILAMLYELAECLREIAGMDAVSLQPAAGAQGEFAGLLMMRAYHLRNGEGDKRHKIIVPDSAHGTNPASAARCGYQVVQVKSSADGHVDIAAMRKALSEEVAAIMMTSPNTLGVFESEVLEISRMAHDAGALMYLDGANMNALVGKAKPGDMGFDVMHFNLHKTFSTPHGGGGPGAGPVAVKKHLEPFLPVPVIEKTADGYRLNDDRPHSIGRLHGFYGNAGILARAWAYIRYHGASGLTANTENAVLNANYLMALLRDTFPTAHQGICKHEFVCSARRFKDAYNVRAWDFAKRLIDYGFHPPTVYFPLIPEHFEAMMIEPTETESKETLDAFAATLLKIAEEAAMNPELVQHAPHTAPVGRLDEAFAARCLNVCWTAEQQNG